MTVSLMWKLFADLEKEKHVMWFVIYLVAVSLVMATLSSRYSLELAVWTL